MSSVSLGNRLVRPPARLSSHTCPLMRDRPKALITNVYQSYVGSILSELMLENCNGDSSLSSRGALSSGKETSLQRTRCQPWECV